ncbi:MAG: cobaltochelatase subunit CobN, partial [Pseudomonadota bacterium]
HRSNPDAPALRLASLADLTHPLSVDLYISTICAKARLVVVRLLGGTSYWNYVIDELTGLENPPLIALLPGDNRPDGELVARSTIKPSDWHILADYCAAGGHENTVSALQFAARLIGLTAPFQPPRPFRQAGFYLDGQIFDDPGAIAQPNGRPVFIAFYRALLQSGDMAAIDGLMNHLRRQRLDPVAFFSHSLKDADALEMASAGIRRIQPKAGIATTGFALAKPDEETPKPWNLISGPIFQLVLSTGSRASWQARSQGLAPRELAMNVALPEVDGRILTRAGAFKQTSPLDPLTQSRTRQTTPDHGRIGWSTRLIRNWIKLGEKQPRSRRIIIMLAHYPGKESRIGNGVGLDTPASIIKVVEQLKKQGYDLADFTHQNGFQLIDHLRRLPHAGRADARRVEAGWSIHDYRRFFLQLPARLQQAVTRRWGRPEADPFFRKARFWRSGARARGDFSPCREQGGFVLPVHQTGRVFFAIQPARGYQIDPVASYHDPDLVPPHHYLAFYGWVRRQVRADLVIQFGKHGNLEWLPGKALCLSASCWPEAVLGPMPVLYPFIVNDPGEGTQAKRRNAAAIIDHLMPPLMRAEIHGDLARLEQLLDEYFEASTMDPRRMAVLESDIFALAGASGIDRDCGFLDQASSSEKLNRLDAFLCDIKETQIRGGLHRFGQLPEGERFTETLIALTRIPRGDGCGANRGLIDALACDLGVSEACEADATAQWQGLRPDALHTVSTAPWRSAADTVERLEKLAFQLVQSGVTTSGGRAKNAPGQASAAVLDYLHGPLTDCLARSAEREVRTVLDGLAGRQIDPGPSGAPSRGRHDVLPTGRNFYSVDIRAIPSPAAWKLGRQSAEQLLEHYVQTHGDWPRHVALSAWGSAAMRTGGDDLAQAMALIGVQPSWDGQGKRVTGFEILPLSILNRPRVDVTLRVSGFFRDAFPNLIDLFDSAIRAVAALDEAPQMNPIAALCHTEHDRLIAEGMHEDDARDLAASRVFGSKPGSYGAGLQAPIDQGCWQSDHDLADAYISWSGYRYRSGREGAAAHKLFRTRLQTIEAVIHNQDNREHDLLDSDDYYQFEGGLSVAIYSVSGKRPAMYHNDHSNPARPKIGQLQDEIARSLHARLTNPKWIEAAMHHGYKGAFEMVAGVDYLFAFQATTGLVHDHHFDKIVESFILDETVRAFLKRHNPAALRDMAGRLLEAMERNLWKPRRNDTKPVLERYGSYQSGPEPRG